MKSTFKNRFQGEQNGTKKAVLHILEITSNITVISQEELALDNHVIQEYVTRHIEKSINDPGMKTGEFLTDSVSNSELNRYLNGEIKF